MFHVKHQNQGVSILAAANRRQNPVPQKQLRLRLDLPTWFGPRIAPGTARNATLGVSRETSEQWVFLWSSRGPWEFLRRWLLLHQDLVGGAKAGTPPIHEAKSG